MIAAFLVGYCVPLAYVIVVAVYEWRMHVRREFPRARALPAAATTWRRFE